MTRVVLFTGKGGVGKTTVAAATAAQAAARGKRVLITSTDPAHSLGDAFDEAIGDEPTPIAPGLHAQQIDAQQRLERHWADVRDYLVEALSYGGAVAVQAEELVLLPGLDEVFALIDLRRQVEDGEWDVVIVDCAPTAETLRLLALPDAMRWYVERLLRPGRRVAKAVRPVMQKVGGMPVPQDEVFGAVERIHRDLAAVHDLLQDGSRSSVRLVVNPERMVVNEALRTATSLALFGYAVDAVVVNRILPDEVTDAYLAPWKQRQAEHLATVEQGFAPTPVLRAPLFPDELVGQDGLAELAGQLYGERDETAILHDGAPLSVERSGEGYVLRLRLPFAAKDDLDLRRRGQDLHLKVSGVKRTLPLPAALQRCEVAAARLRDGVLQIDFRLPVPATAGSAPGGPA